MRLAAIITILAFSSVIAACSEDPVQPPADPVMGPQLASDGAEIVTIDWVYNSNRAWPFPCANGGAGDDIRFQGQAYWQFHLVFTPGGNVHGTYRLVDLDFTYTSDRNGDTYIKRGVRKGGAQTEHEIIGKVGSIFQMNDLFTLVNQRTGEVLQQDEHYHLMVLPDEVREHDHWVETCK